jgi:hypothetical protein
MTRKPGPNDAHLWAVLTQTLRAAGAPQPDVLARRLVADVRRERAPKTRTFGPGDPIPYDVTRGTDLDGDLWVRLGENPNERDMWRMPGFDPDQHDPELQGCQVMPFLLESYGPITEVKR